MKAREEKSVLSILKKNLESKKHALQSEPPTHAQYIQLRDNELYRLKGGEDSDQGIKTLRVDFSRDVVINSKTKDSYLMFLRWLQALPETETKQLSELDRTIKKQLKLVDLTQDEELLVGRNAKPELAEIFKLFLRRELNFSNEDLEEVNRKYTQGVGGACFGGILDVQLKMTALEDLEEKRTYTYTLNTPRSAYRHCLINNEYHVIGLGGEFRSEEMPEEKEESEDSDINDSKYSETKTGRNEIRQVGPIIIKATQTDATGEVVFTKKGYKIVSTGGIFRRLLVRLFTASSDNEFKKGIISAEQESKESTLNFVFSEIGKEKESQEDRLKEVINTLGKCNPPADQAAQQMLTNMKAYAQEISQLPDVTLADFTNALEKITKFFQGSDPKKITEEIQELANKYYGLLVINKQKKLDETVQKTYKETESKDIKTKLGKLLYIHLDSLTKLPNPMYYNLVSIIEKLDTDIVHTKKSSQNLEEFLDQSLFNLEDCRRITNNFNFNLDEEMKSILDKHKISGALFLNIPNLLHFVMGKPDSDDSAGSYVANFLGGRIGKKNGGKLLSLYTDLYVLQYKSHKIQPEFQDRQSSHLTNTAFTGISNQAEKIFTSTNYKARGTSGTARINDFKDRFEKDYKGNLEKAIENKLALSLTMYYGTARNEGFTDRISKFEDNSLRVLLARKLFGENYSAKQLESDTHSLSFIAFERKVDHAIKMQTLFYPFANSADAKQIEQMKDKNYFDNWVMETCEKYTNLIDQMSGGEKNPEERAQWLKEQAPQYYLAQHGNSLRTLFNFINTGPQDNSHKQFFFREFLVQLCHETFDREIAPTTMASHGSNPQTETKLATNLRAALEEPNLEKSIKMLREFISQFDNGDFDPPQRTQTCFFSRDKREAEFYRLHNRLGLRLTYSQGDRTQLLNKGESQGILSELAKKAGISIAPAASISHPRL